MENRNIIFFDGVCNLCNNFIDYVIRRDKNKIIFYSSLQSDFAIKLLKDHDINLDKGLSTVFYYKDNKLYSQSKAIMYIFLELSMFHKIVARIGLCIPAFLRNLIYNFIANNRYRFFGKKESCRLPSPEEKDQFIS